MMPWEFVIQKRSDLPVFADLLAEHRHPGEAVVRHLITNKKFPSTLSGGLYVWRITFKEANGRNWDGKDYQEFLPYGSLRAVVHEVKTIPFYSRTEAIWAVVNAGKYLPTLTGSACRRTSRAGGSRHTSPARRR